MKKRIFFLALICLWLIPSCGAFVNSKPAILVSDSAGAIIENGISEFDFGLLTRQNPRTETFWIKNTGKEVLNLIGSPKVIITGSNASAFSVIIQPASPLFSKVRTIFTIEFKPDSIKIYSGVVTIANNDSDENPFTFTITGTGISAAEINVKQGIVNIPNKTGVFTFGSLSVGISSPAVVFTIENLGIQDLFLTGTPEVAITGGDAPMFALDLTTLKSLIPPTSSTFFMIKFKPTNIGSKSAMISISNSDYDENPYTFRITGIATVAVNAPEINVKQDVNNIPSGSGSYDFGNIPIFTSGNEIAFTIENLGNAMLNLTGDPNKIVKFGGDTFMFSLDQSMTLTPVSAGLATIFTIIFEPRSVGLKSTTIVISNDDPDENPYTFTVTGTGILAPEIAISQGGTNIPCTAGKFDFGRIDVGTSSVDIIFTIENIGTEDLILTGSPIVEISGVDAALFSIDQNATTSPIASGNSTTFTIKFTPTNRGLKSAEISIFNTDLDENPFIFKITGRGGTSENFVYVLDRSGSMSSRYSGPTTVYDKNGNVIPYPSKWQYIQSVIAQEIYTLDDTNGFEIITYHTPIYVCFSNVMDATTQNKQTAIAWLYAQGIDG